MTGCRTFILSVRDLMCDSKYVPCAVGACVVSTLLSRILVLITVNGSSEWTNLKGFTWGQPWPNFRKTPVTCQEGRKKTMKTRGKTGAPSQALTSYPRNMNHSRSGFSPLVQYVHFSALMPENEVLRRACYALGVSVRFISIMTGRIIPRVRFLSVQYRHIDKVLHSAADVGCKTNPSVRIEVVVKMPFVIYNCHPLGMKIAEMSWIYALLIIHKHRFFFLGSDIQFIGAGRCCVVISVVIEILVSISEAGSQYYKFVKVSSCYCED